MYIKDSNPYSNQANSKSMLGGHDPAQATHESSISRAFAELGHEFTRAEEMLEILADRLKPVRSERDSLANGSVGQPAPPPECQIEERLLQLLHRVKDIADRINVVSSQICL